MSHDNVGDNPATGERVTMPNTPASVSDPWKDGKEHAQHLTECGDDDCDRCSYLIDGFYLACDQCGHWGHQDSNGWVTANGVPFCSEDCAKQWFGESVEIQ